MTEAAAKEQVRDELSKEIGEGGYTRGHLIADSLRVYIGAHVLASDTLRPLLHLVIFKIQQELLTAEGGA